MKKFICVSPRQSVYPLNYSLVKNAVVVDREADTGIPVSYEPVDCEYLRYDKPCGFPIVPVIHACTEPGDEIQVLVLTADNPAAACDDEASFVGTHINFELLRQDIAAICREKGIKATLKKILIPAEERVAIQIGTFEKLTRQLQEGDSLYADITYGTKTGMYAILLALAYAHKTMTNCHVESVVYGEAQFNRGKLVKRKLYDETKLFLLDQIMTDMTLQNVENPAQLLRNILHLDSDGEDEVCGE